MVQNGNDGIHGRKRDDTIGCYLRIPNDYAYDGWKTDYKTGEMKIVIKQKHSHIAERT